MHIKLTETMFKDEFQKMGRSDNFSYEGLSALYKFLEEMEEDTGEDTELDVIALCCDFSEEPLQDVLENYNLDSWEELEECTLVIAYPGDNVLYQVF